MSKQLEENVLNQVEFYLSDKNLLNSRNDNLRTIITRDGMVELASLCSYPRMRSYLKIGKKDVITEEEVQAVAKMLRNSEFLSISIDGKKVGRKTPLPTATAEEMDMTVGVSPIEYVETEIEHYSTDEEAESSKIRVPKGKTITVKFVHKASRGDSKRKRAQDDITRKDLNDVFERFGRIEHIRFIGIEEPCHIQFEESEASDKALVATVDGGLPVNNYMAILERYSGYARSFQMLPRKDVRPPNPFMVKLRNQQYREPSTNQLFPKKSKDPEMPRFGVWWCIPGVHYLVKEAKIPAENHLPPEEACRPKIHYMKLVKGRNTSKNPNAPKIPSYQEIKTRYLNEILDSEHPYLKDPLENITFRTRRFYRHLRDQNVLDQEQATELMLSCHMTFQMADLVTDMRHRAMEFAARERCVCNSVPESDRYQMQADDLCTLIRDLLGPQFEPAIHVKNVDGNLMLHEITLYVNEAMEVLECIGMQYSGASNDLIMF